MPEQISAPEENETKESILEYRRRLKKKQDKINAEGVREYLEETLETLATTSYVEGLKKGKWEGLFWGFVLGALVMLLFTIFTGG